MTRQRFANLGIPVTLYCGDALEVSLPKHFEIVLSTGVIEHFVDPEPIIISHARLAKPGGHVIVTVPNCISPRQPGFSRDYSTPIYCRFITSRQ